jgi:hypothetical protein
MPGTGGQPGHGDAEQQGADSEDRTAIRPSDASPRAPAISHGGGAPAGEQHAATRQRGEDGVEARVGRGRWARRWRVSAACVAAVACTCALVFLLPDGGRGLEGDSGGGTFEMVEQTLDAALSPRDLEDARLRGWSRAQILALRDPLALGDPAVANSLKSST